MKSQVVTDEKLLEPFKSLIEAYKQMKEDQKNEQNKNFTTFSLKT